MNSWTLAQKHDEAIAHARKRRRKWLYPPGIIAEAAGIRKEEGS